MRFLILLTALLLIPAHAGEKTPQAEQPGESTFSLHDLHYQGDDQLLHSLGLTQEANVEVSAACCKICKKGKACGDSCIKKSYTWHKGKGCACDGRVESRNALLRSAKSAWSGVKLPFPAQSFLFVVGRMATSFSFGRRPTIFEASLNHSHTLACSSPGRFGFRTPQAVYLAFVVTEEGETGLQRSVNGFFFFGGRARPCFSESTQHETASIEVPVLWALLHVR